MLRTYLCMGVVRSIWGRLFPRFTEKETRLRSELAIREAISNTKKLALESVRNFWYERTSTPTRLREQAENAHYSTFKLYTKEEFSEALNSFLKSLSRSIVTWSDENVLFVCERRP